MQIGGSSATDDEYIFSSIVEMLPLRDGSLVLVDRGPPLIARVYNAEGKFVRSLGRQGDGPGEYRNPAGIAQHQDGRILIRDADGRISVYGSSGPGAQFFAPASSGTAVGGDFLSVAPGGTVQMRTTSFSPRAQVFAPDILRIKPDGSFIDTLHGPVISSDGSTRLAASADRATTTLTIPYSPTTEIAFSPLGYFVLVHTGKYQIDLRVPRTSSMTNGAPSTWRDGDPVISIRRSVVPVVIAEEERAEARKRIEDGMRRMQSNWQWNGPDVPRVKPAIKSILFGADGSIWVPLSQPSQRVVLSRDGGSASGGAVLVGAGGGGGADVGGARGDRSAVTPPTSIVAWREPQLYDLFSPDGTYVGQVAVPSGTTIITRKGDHAWGLTRDSDGVLTVHRFRIVWG